MRVSTLIDQLFIKACRIRAIEEAGTQKVGDSIEEEYIGIVNYAIITLMQLGLPSTLDPTSGPTPQALESMYVAKAKEARTLMLAKNHDYGEAWRSMQITSFTDMFLTRINRIKQLSTNSAPSAISEGVEANLLDMINYALFARILTHEKKL